MISFYKLVPNNRKKVLTYLEKNRFFGLSYSEWAHVDGGQKRDVVFFEDKDVPFLQDKIQAFLIDQKTSESEKIKKLLLSSNNSNTNKIIKQYMREKTATPIITEAVSLLMKVVDLPQINNSQIEALLEKAQSSGAKDALIAILNLGKQMMPVAYDYIYLNKEPSTVITAYPDDVYLGLASCIFNAEHIREQKMIEKALDNHLYAEMWLYVSLFFCCGWRAQDVCRGWKYPNLNDDFGIKKETLYDDILNDKLPSEVYENICLYSTTAIEVSMQMPSKTANHDPDILRCIITPELMPFFGLLTLISETHYLKNKEGHMKPERAAAYQHRKNLKRFFGQHFYDILGGNNLHTRRLNKDYLQGVEESAIKEGASGVLASTIASFARNHTNHDTIARYLRDHKFSDLTAEFAVYSVMDRGVLGFEMFQTLLTAYPEKMAELSVREQTQLIQKMGNAYQLELAGTNIAASFYIEEKFQKGDAESVLTVLKAMFAVSQNKGKAKDIGVHCWKRLKGEVCPHPEFESCLANACPYLIMTRYGYLPLIRILNNYRKKAMAGDKKSEAILTKKLMPVYREILNRFMKETGMTQAMRAGMKKIMEVHYE